MPEVREELADKVRSSLLSSESEHLRDVIFQGIKAADPNVAAAFVDLAAKMNTYSNADEGIIGAISTAFDAGGACSLEFLW